MKNNPSEGDPDSTRNREFESLKPRIEHWFSMNYHYDSALVKHWITSFENSLKKHKLPSNIKIDFGETRFYCMASSKAEFPVYQFKPILNRALRGKAPYHDWEVIGLMTADECDDDVPDAVINVLKNIQAQTQEPKGK
ncbi:MAG: hypothetical protein WCT24_01330 [Patescibacteria group bacterium]|jgi:hypothetical protein